jgi:CHAT domain-containing protein/tetratricopeptide (TPR) repeat protein
MGMFAVLSVQTFALPDQTAVHAGVIVEKVEKDLGAGKAGILEGDVLLSWSRGGPSGQISSPFDLAGIEIEQRPRGEVTIDGLRLGERREWKLTPASWGMRVRPNLSAGAALEAVAHLAQPGHESEAASQYLEIATQMPPEPAWLRIWLLLRGAELLAQSQQWEKSDGAFQQAVELSGADKAITEQLLEAWGDTFGLRSRWAEAEAKYKAALEIASRSDSSLMQAHVLRALGRLSWRRWDVDGAEKYYQQALNAEEKLAAESLGDAESLKGLGDVENRRGHLDKAEGYYQRALLFSRKLDPESLEAAGGLFGLGNDATDRGEYSEAEAYLEQALVIQRKRAPRSLALATTLDWLGLVARFRGDIDKMESWVGEALAIQESEAPESLDVAGSLLSLGDAQRVRGDYQKVKEYFTHARSIAQKLAPDSLFAVTTLAALGYLELWHGDVSESEKYYREALSIAKRAAPDSTYVSSPLTRLGNIASDRGDLNAAQNFFNQSVEIEKKLAANTGIVNPANLVGLGSIAWKRGDLTTADEYFRQALAITEKAAPGNVQVGAILVSLGLVDRYRGDSAGAEAYYQRALVIFQKVSPKGDVVSQTMNSLGEVYRDQGDWAKAEDCFQQALKIDEAIALEGLETASDFNALGNLANDRRQYAEAEKYHRRALAIQEKLDPDSMPVAESLGGLGEVFSARGDWDSAEQYQGRALLIWQRIAPMSAGTARTFAALAGIATAKQQPEAAGQFYQQAIDTLENQTARLGGAEEIRAAFRAKHENYYQDYIDLLLQQKKPEQAFQVLERSRARTLLEVLAAGRVDVNRGADPALLQQEVSLRQSVTAKSNQRIRLLSAPHSEVEIKGLDAEIAQLYSQQQEVQSQLRAKSPDYAALTQPKLLTAGEVQQQLLDADTLLLEYSLGPESSNLFALGADSLRAYKLPGRETVESAARLAYRVLSNNSPQAKADYGKAATELSRMILGPASAELGNKRLLIVADGALAYIPFGALPAPGADSRHPVPLVVDHEIVNLPSASVLAVLRQQQNGRTLAAKSVAVFADPVFTREDPRVELQARATPARAVIGSDRSSAVASTDALVRSAGDLGLTDQHGLHLTRLLYSSLEAEKILAVVPARQRWRAVGFQASRSAVVSRELAQYRIVHFATHGLLDSRHPELSGLVFSLVDRRGRPESGFLGLEDIYNLKLSADLVVLSACETGLGKEIAGEGLLGLSRGFMHAGASRVVASLWRVSDQATALLMERFYRAMNQGMRPAAALRAAQVQMSRQGPWHDPYYWAAFQIQGEWR